MRDAVQPGQYGVSVDLAFHAAGRARAAQQQRGITQRGARIHEEAPHLMRAGRGKRPVFLGVVRHHHHQHQRIGPMALDDIERVPLAEEVAVMQAEHNVRHHLHFGRHQIFERALEIVHAAAQVIDLGEGVLRADHIHHRHVDTGVFHAACDVEIDQGGMQGYLECGEGIFDAANRRIIRRVFHFVAVIRAAGEQHALRAEIDLRTHHAPQVLRRARRNHRFQDFCLAVVTGQLAFAAGNRHRGPRLLATPFNFGGSVSLKSGGIKIDARCFSNFRTSRHLCDQGGIERNVFQRIDLPHHLQPITHPPPPDA